MSDHRPLREQLVGTRAIADALDAGRAPRLLIAADGQLPPAERAILARCASLGVAIRRASGREMRRLCADLAPRAEPPDLLALLGGDPDATLEVLLAAGGALWLLVGVAYPGNAGFSIRTAEVSGAAGIAIDATFDRTGRRQALRAAMRADRFFPVLWRDGTEVVRLAREAGARVLGIESHGTCTPWEADLRGPALVVVGGEAGGIPAPILELCDAVLRIPMAGFIPAYNLQAAVAIVAAERLRQQQQASP